MIGYDIYDCFTIEHFRLRQRMTLTTKIYCSRLYIALKVHSLKRVFFKYRLKNSVFIVIYGVDDCGK
jgi:hypothetical protein